MAKRKTSEQGNPDARPSALEWLMSHKQPKLLPTPWLTDAELEDFTEAVLVAQRLLGKGFRHVAHVERWGVPGDKQDGIRISSCSRSLPGADRPDGRRAPARRRRGLVARPGGRSVDSPCSVISPHESLPVFEPLRLQYSSPARRTAGAASGRALPW